MIQQELRKKTGVLVLHPQGPLEASDFEELAHVVDPYIEQHGKLHGLVIDAKTAPGWKNYDALKQHVKFVKEHHRGVERVALVTDNALMSRFPKIASRLLSPEIRSFDAAHRDDAIAWAGSH